MNESLPYPEFKKEINNMGFFSKIVDAMTDFVALRLL